MVELFIVAALGIAAAMMLWRLFISLGPSEDEVNSAIRMSCQSTASEPPDDAEQLALEAILKEMERDCEQFRTEWNDD